MTLEQARQHVADRFPEALIDTMGREHPSITRAAVLRGDWDAGKLVQDARKALVEKGVGHD